MHAKILLNKCWVNFLKNSPSSLIRFQWNESRHRLSILLYSLNIIKLPILKLPLLLLLIYSFHGRWKWIPAINDILGVALGLRPPTVHLKLKTWYWFWLLHSTHMLTTCWRLHIIWLNWQMLPGCFLKVERVL